MNKLISTIIKFSIAPIVKILFIKDLKGLENLPKTNFILASNHQSYIDVIVCGYICLPRKFTFIGQVDKGKGLFKFFRDLIYFLAGVIPLKRTEKKSKKQSFEKAIKALNNNYCLVIYPEGKRSETGKIQEGKWGVAKLFLETRVPIVPLGITGAFNIMPPKGKLKMKKMIELNIGKPILFKKEYQSNNYEKDCITVTNKVMEEIKKLMHEN
jgi:1-acyl-sn-glycerol-3-phosphate acyltransferase